MQSRLHTQRILRSITAFLCGCLFAFSVANGEVPAFVKEPIYSPNAATVSKVVSSSSADIVVLKGGLEQGIRLGMVCTVNRGLKSIGEVIIIESRSDRAAGLILNLVDASTIQAGDIARVKTLQTS